MKLWPRKLSYIDIYVLEQLAWTRLVPPFTHPISGRGRHIQQQKLLLVAISALVLCQNPIPATRTTGIATSFFLSFSFSLSPFFYQIRKLALDMHRGRQPVSHSVIHAVDQIAFLRMDTHSREGAIAFNSLLSGFFLSPDLSISGANRISKGEKRRRRKRKGGRTHPSHSITLLSSPTYVQQIKWGKKLG